MDDLFGLGSGKSRSDRPKVGADNQSVERLREKMEQYSAKVARVPSTTDLFIILGLVLAEQHSAKL